MRVLRASACVLALGAGSPAIAAGPAGASSCTGCHGVAGPAAPLEGRPAGQIATAMAAFRAAERSATVMGRIARGFSEGETQAIASWFAAQAPGGPRAKP